MAGLLRGSAAIILPGLRLGANASFALLGVACATMHTLVCTPEETLVCALYCLY